MAKAKPVYTYFSSLPGSNPDHAARLLLIWRDAWAKQGYEPIVLNETHARKHELASFLENKVRMLPTLNVIEYEMACYMRWAAMAAVGGGIMTDADVIPYGPVEEFNRQGQKTTLTSLQGHVPCCVFGSKAAYEQVVRQMIEYKVSSKDVEEGEQMPHVSDMYMFYRGGITFTSRDIVKSFGDEGWEQAPLVHFSNASMKGKQPRHEWIPKLRAI
jgi:hypothetical protein